MKHPHPPTLVDIGANLGHESFAHDLDQVLQGAYAAGVAQLVITGASGPGSVDALAIARRDPQRLAATAGLHPHHATDFDAELESLLAELLKAPEVRAGGECGLDYFRDLSPRPAQLHAFERQLMLTVAAGKPAFLHQREAHADFLGVLKDFRDRLPGVVVHCFTDTREALYDYLDLDCHIGITGWICDERRGSALLPLVREIPCGRLMIETDAPYLLPRSLKPRPKTHRNEPRWLPEVLRVVAEARGESPDDTAAHTTATARAFFALPERVHPHESQS